MGRRRTAIRLGLWMNGHAVGTWTVDAAGRHRLDYDADWTASGIGRPISLSMPLRPAAGYSGDVVRNWFENLLPDSRVIRERLQARFRTRSTQAQDLLAEIGRDCIGALSLLPDGESPRGVDRIDGVPLTDADIGRALERVTSDSRDAEDADFRISIAGAQEKTAFLQLGDRWLRPRGSTPTTHLFKLPLGVAPSGIDLSTSVENEWLCARILAAYGVPVALGEIRRFGGRKVLVVPRFDRRPAPGGRGVLRVPQEDFAQACGIGPDDKYEADGGPGIATILDRLAGSTRSREDRHDFMRSQVIFWMLAAIDGHAKNFSVFIEPRGRFRLAPRYDVLSAYPVMGRGHDRLAPEKVRMAMAFRGRNRHYRWAEIRREHVEATATACGLGASIEALLDELVERTPQVIREVGAAVPTGVPDAVAAPILDGLGAAADRLKQGRGRGR